MGSARFIWLRYSAVFTYCIHLALQHERLHSLLRIGWNMFFHCNRKQACILLCKCNLFWDFHYNFFCN